MTSRLRTAAATCGTGLTLSSLKIGLAGLTILCSCGSVAAPPVTEPRWIGPVTVVDVLRGALIPNIVLHIVDGKIVELVPSSALSATARAALIAAPAPYAAPGLWDMHGALTRYAPTLEHPAQLSFGVTRIRSIVSCPKEGVTNIHPCVADVTRWNEAVRICTLAGPLVMGTGTFPLNGPEHRHPDMPPSAALRNEDDAKAFVREFKSLPVRPDHIKSYDGIPRASFFALLDEARTAGIEVSGHVPVAVPLTAAARAGMKAIAHARVLPIACSDREDEIIGMRMNKVRRAEWMRRALETQDATTCAKLWNTLREQGVYLSPTLITRYNETSAGLQALAADKDTMAMVPWIFATMWQEDVDDARARAVAEEHVYRDYYKLAGRLVAQAQAAGVTLLLGSDTFDTFVAPGVGLHQEMQLWRQAGIANADVLRAATVNAARYFGLEATHGQVAANQVADIVFVNDNPLASLSTLREPAGLMQAGRYYDRAALTQVRQQAKDGARSWRFTIKLLWDWAMSPLSFMK